MPHADTVPCLVALSEEFDEVGPDRSTASDGSIGDQDHAERSSNHNKDDTSGSSTPQSDSDSSPDIRAIDVTSKGPWLNGMTMQAAVDLIVGRCRSGAENRLVEVIYNRHAWYKSNGWARIDYTGSNPHDKHAHFGAKADTGKLENDTRPWGLVEKWGGGEMFLVKNGAQGEIVKYWQYYLNDLGFSPGAIDGDYGDSTQAAVNAHRKSHGQGPVNEINGWHAYVIQRDMMDKRAKVGPAGPAGPKGATGPAGPAGPAGAPGAPGADGALSGTFTVTGGQIEVATA